MRALNIFTGRTMRLMIILLPLCVSLLVCVLMALSAEESDEYSSRFMMSLMCMIAGPITAYPILGGTANGFFRSTAGSKYFRTVKNGGKLFVRAMGISALRILASSIIIVSLAVAASALMGALPPADGGWVLFGQPVFGQMILYILQCASGVLFISGYSFLTLFIKNPPLRMGLSAAVMFLCVLMTSFVFNDIIEQKTYAEGLILYAITAVCGLVFAGLAYLALYLGMPKLWLKDQ
ncbi:MAG: hypothetical protein J1E39_05280 [Eubacterium sp.]|nr:hypothetical protein [Eubacterium sp.]